MYFELCLGRTLRIRIVNNSGTFAITFSNMSKFVFEPLKQLSKIVMGQEKDPHCRLKTLQNKQPTAFLMFVILYTVGLGDLLTGSKVKWVKMEKARTIVNKYMGEKTNRHCKSWMVFLHLYLIIVFHKYACFSDGWTDIRGRLIKLDSTVQLISNLSLWTIFGKAILFLDTLLKPAQYGKRTNKTNKKIAFTCV